MRSGGFRVVAALVLLGLLAAITAGAYGAGYAAGSGTGVVVTGNGTMAPWAYGGFFGVGHVIGFVVSIIVLSIVIRLIALVFWGGGHWGHRRAWAGRGWDRTDATDWNKGPWHAGPWHDARRAMFDEMHREAHGQPGAETGSTGQPGSSGPTGPAEPKV